MNINEKTETQIYDYGCVMANINIKNEDKYKELIDNIDESDLYNNEKNKYGIETDYHVTVLYGLHDDIDQQYLTDILQLVKPFHLFLNDVSIFENENYDVLKFDVYCPELHTLNKLLKDNFEYTSNFPDYKPHCTIGYFKPGCAEKYISKFKQFLQICKCSEFTNSMANGNKEKIDINNTAIINTQLNIIESFTSPMNNNPKLWDEVIKTAPIDIDDPREKYFKNMINNMTESTSIKLSVLTGLLDKRSSIYDKYYIKFNSIPKSINEIKNDKFKYTISIMTKQCNDRNLNHFFTFEEGVNINELLDFLKKIK